MRGKFFQTEISELSSTLQHMPLLSVSTRVEYGIVFWLYVLMGNELGNKTGIDLVLVSSVMTTPIFTVIGNNIFFTILV